MAIFKENNPRILKSIIEYRNGNDEAGDDEDSNRDYTLENNENNDNNVDYNFYNENKLQ